jgi:CRISPR-associated protein Csb1
MSDLLTKYDAWLTDDGPAALVIREHLMPVEGRDGVLFPATFAAEQGNAPDRFRGGYNIDPSPDAENNVCLIDTVGSQANRVEPIFAKPKYARLVPQITVKAGEKHISLLEAGHRAGDAIVRCSRLQDGLQGGFKDLLKGNAEPLAKIAPTSLVFGVWDSRDTQARVPRLVSSTIRAFNVRRLTRHGQYIPATAYVDEGLLPEPEGTDNYAERGFKHQPVSRPSDPKKPDPTHGGVIATGGVRRDATLNLAALRLLSSGADENKTKDLRRYILGLALAAFTHPSAFIGYLRQGCTLVLDPDAKPEPREFVEVYPDGRRVPATITHDDALQYAQEATKTFGVGQNQDVEFEKKKAEADLAGDDKKGKKGAKRAAK